MIERGTTLFKVLDLLADSTNIVLLVWLVGVLVMGTIQKRFTFRHWALSVLSIVSIYVVKDIDGKYHFWKHLALDYSTHTALAAAVVVSLCFLVPTRRVLALIIFVAYEVLMLLLGFHTIADEVSTLVIVAPILLAIWLLGTRETAKPVAPIVA